MELRVLGPIEALHGGVSLALGGPKQRSVLALLIASAGRPVSVDALIQGVYGDDASGGARRTIHTYVSNLRRELGDVITKAGDGYVLACDRIDAQEFGRLFRDGTDLVDERPDRAAGILREALALWRGHAYADVEDRAALRAEISRLEELRLAAIDARIEADLAVGLHRELIGELEGLTAEHPLRESFRAHQMIALYRSGRQSEALRAFGRTRTLLAEELGIDPSSELRDLELAILSQDPKLDVRIKATIEARAVLAGELDDGVRYLSHRERDRALFERDEAFGEAVSAFGGTQLGVRGMAVYAAFPDAVAALGAARTLVDGNLRLAVDHGELEISRESTSGPPISRALRLAAVAHPGQVLLSPDAHTRLSTEQAAGWSVLSLGSFAIRGLDGPLPVFQLTGAGIRETYPGLLVDRLPPPMPDRHTSGSVPGYELRDELGGGPAGAVYRAYQASIGREVAVRVIRPDVVADPRFIRRFEATAQRVAAISHPHLVELVDYWRDPAQAFLVYRLIDGGSLTEVVGSPLRVIEQVGTALGAAHDAGLPHGRVRPESVLLDGEGNAYLSGLGVVSMLHDLVPFPADAFTAPEVIGGDATVAGDVYSLGSLAAALLAGPQPTDGPPLSITGRLDEVIARATAPDPAQRQSDVRELVSQLSAAMNGPAHPSDGPVRNPYKGLAAFQEADAVDFFGRSAVVAALVEAARDNPLTVVVGPSGIGKSSVVRAGLIPALRRGALPGSEEWLVADMFPGSRPFDELEVALARVSTQPPSDQVDMLRSGRTGLVEAAQALLPVGSTLLLVVDQFEELFTHVVDEAVRRRFLDLLVDIHDRQESPVRVVVTLRADFFDRPLRNAAFGELLDDVLVTVSAPTADELAEIVTWPGRGVGLRPDEGLVATLVADADGESGGLPLLQHALTELFETRDGDRLTLASYVEAGGLAGSIGRRADAIYESLSDEDQATARNVFVRLVTVDENAEDTRRRVRIAELDGIGASRASVDRALDAFGRHRLLVFDRDAATRGPTVEVAHEALIRHWDRLGDWIDERREVLLTHRRVEIATRDWVASGRDPSYLMAGTRLAQADALGEELGRDSDQAEFLAESRQTVERERARRTRNRRRVTTSLSGALALAVALGSFGWAQRGVAEREAITSRMHQLAVEAEAAIDEDPDLAILLALEAYDMSEHLDLERTPGEVMRALQVTSQSSRLLGRLPHGFATAAMSADGGVVALDDATQPRMVHVYNTNDLAAAGSFDAGGPVGWIDFDPAGELLAVGHSDPLRGLGEEAFVGSPSVSVFDSDGFTKVFDIGELGVAHEAKWSHDGRYLAVIIDDGTVVFDRTGEVVARYPFYGEWVAGADRLAYSDAQGVTVIEVPSGEEARRIDTPGVEPSLFALSPDGAGLALGSFADREVQWWATGLSEPVFAFTSPGIQSVRLDPSGRYLISQGNDSAVIFTELSSGRDHLVLAGHQGGSYDIAVTPDASRAFVPTYSGTLVWDLTEAGPADLGNLDVDGDITDFMLAGPTGQVAVTATEGRASNAAVLDLATGTVVSSFGGMDAEHFFVAPKTAPGGEVVGIDAVTGMTSVFDPVGTVLYSDFESCETPAGISGEYGIVVTSRAACSPRGEERFVDFHSGRVVYQSEDSAPLTWAEFGRRGTLAEGVAVTVRASGQIDVVSLEAGTVLGTVRDSQRIVFVPRMSPDGRWAVFGSQVGGIVMVDVAAVLEGEPQSEWVRTIDAGDDGPTNGAAVGTKLAASTHSGAATRIFDLESGRIWFELPINTSNTAAVAFTDDERYLYYEDSDGVVRRVPTLGSELAEVARTRATRQFTVEECERFLIDTDCSVYEET